MRKNARLSPPAQLQSLCSGAEEPGNEAKAHWKAHKWSHSQAWVQATWESTTPADRALLHIKLTVSFVPRPWPPNYNQGSAASCTLAVTVSNLQYMTEAVSTTCAVHIENHEGRSCWWLKLSGQNKWPLKPIPSDVTFFTCVITLNKSLYFNQGEASMYHNKVLCTWVMGTQRGCPVAISTRSPHWWRAPTLSTATPLSCSSVRGGSDIPWWITFVLESMSSMDWERVLFMDWEWVSSIDWEWASSIDSTLTDWGIEVLPSFSNDSDPSFLSKTFSFSTSLSVSLNLESLLSNVVPSLGDNESCSWLSKASKNSSSLPLALSPPSWTGGTNSADFSTSLSVDEESAGWTVDTLTVEWEWVSGDFKSWEWGSW